MNVRPLGRLLSALVAISFVATAVRGAEAPPRPNLIIINIDDLGYAEVGPYGGKVPTPAIDRLAREGRKLTSHYAAPVCTPSRASLMTGCYAKRVMPIPHVLFPVARLGLNPQEQTIAKVLKSAGYVTAAIGKWHLGDQREFLPTRHGFDSYYGLPYSNDMGPNEDGAKTNLGGAPLPSNSVRSDLPRPAAPKSAPPKSALKQAAQDADTDTGARGRQPPLALIENETVIGRVRQEEQARILHQYTERAVNFIKQPRQAPFFLYLAPNAVHFPHYPGAGFAGRSGKDLLRDWVMEVDVTVDEILRTLREQKLEERTLVVFTSDNGGPTYQGAINTPLRGAKGTTWEGGIRVATIAWWPGRIPAGTTTADITAMIDLLPTFAALAGAKLDPSRRIDGVNIWPTLAGNGGKSPRDSFAYFRGLELEAVRVGNWKLRLPSNELFDLSADIAEAHSVATEHPVEVERLRAFANGFGTDLGLAGIGPGCRKPGYVANPVPLMSADGTVRPDMASISSLRKL